MSTIDIRKPLHDQLITDFAALTHSNGTDALFATVEKIYIDYPTAVPACQILVSQPSVDVLGITSDNRRLGFSSIVYELIEQSTNQAAANSKIDRLSDIEDQIMAYLEQIPHPIERAVSNVHVANIVVNPSIYNYQETEKGIMIFQTINFELVVNVVVRSL